MSVRGVGSRGEASGPEADHGVSGCAATPPVRTQWTKIPYTVDADGNSHRQLAPRDPPQITESHPARLGDNTWSAGHSG